MAAAAARAGDRVRANAALPRIPVRSGRRRSPIGVAVLLLLAVASPAGCGGVSTRTDEDEAIAGRLIGRWQGAVVDPPAGTWFEDGTWDVWFSPSGDFSARVFYYGDEERHALRLAGEYRVHHGLLRIDEPSLRGDWTVLTPDENHAVLRHGDVTLALSRRHGS